MNIFLPDCEQNDKRLPIIEDIIKRLVASVHTAPSIKERGDLVRELVYFRNYRDSIKEHWAITKALGKTSTSSMEYQHDRQCA